MRLSAVRDRAKWLTFFFAGWNRAELWRRRVVTALAVSIFLVMPAAGQPGAVGDNERRISLTEALSLAEENASEVKAAYHDSLSAEQGLRASKSQWFPTLGLIGNAFGLHPQDPLGIGPVRIDPRWNTVYAANFRLSYPIYTGGRRSNDIRRQRANLGARSDELAAARLANALECRQAYIGLLIADRMLGAAEASYRRVAVIHTHVQNLFAAGMADSIDILETEISIREAKRLAEQMKTRKQNASTRLASLLAVPADQTIVPTESVPEPSPPSAERAAAMDVSNRPELSVLDHRIASAEYQRSMVKAGFLPVVNGLGGYAVVKPDFGAGESNWQDIWWLGLTLSWDLNLGGKESAESNQALEAIRSLEMTRDDVRDSLALQAQIAWNNVDAAYVVYTISREELDIAARRFALAEDKQKAGRLTVSELLELEAELAQTEQQFEAARLEYFAAVTDYLYAVGSDALWEGL
jgi:outer membrane protein TolC